VVIYLLFFCHQHNNYTSTNTCNVLKPELTNHTGDYIHTVTQLDQGQAINSMKFTSWVISCGRGFNDQCGCCFIVREAVHFHQ